MQRAVTISVNTAGVLGQAEVPMYVIDPINYLLADVPPRYSRVPPPPDNRLNPVFVGGQVSDENGDPYQIAGIASYTELLRFFHQRPDPAADVQGNVVLVPAFLAYSIHHSVG